MRGAQHSQGDGAALEERLRRASQGSHRKGRATAGSARAPSDLFEVPVGGGTRPDRRPGEQRSRPTAIGAVLGKALSAISRELRRNAHTTAQYRPFHAHNLAATRRRRVRPLKLATRPELDTYVRSKMEQRWSPQQISRALKRAHRNDPTMQLATESIYLAIYRPSAGLLRRPAPSPLGTGRNHRRAHTRQIHAGRRFAQPMLSVHERGLRTDRSVSRGPLGG